MKMDDVDIYMYYLITIYHFTCCNTFLNPWFRVTGSSTSMKHDAEGVMYPLMMVWLCTSTTVGYGLHNTFSSTIGGLVLSLKETTRVRPNATRNKKKLYKFKYKNKLKMQEMSFQSRP
jgi:Kef-type K+ transport system membrane component KefB